MSKIHKKNIHAKICPKCGEFVSPQMTNRINEMHGHYLTCPACKQFMGWGGKIDKSFADARYPEQAK